MLTPLVTHSTDNLALVLVGLLGLAQLLGVRLWLAAFALFAFLAPDARGAPHAALRDRN